MIDIQITDNGVNKCINRLNEKKASGPDKIPIPFLKQSADFKTPADCHLYSNNLYILEKYHETGKTPILFTSPRRAIDLNPQIIDQFP